MVRKGRKKLYIIGIDAAALWIIKENYKKYNLKGFEQFIRNGTLENMKSTLPPITPVAWPSIYTGLEPREHGIMDFFCIDKEYTKQLLYYDVAGKQPFWDALSDHGIRSLVITPPMVVNLNRKRNVDMMTGWPLPPKFSSEELQKAAKRFAFKGEEDIEQDLQNGKIGIPEAFRRYEQSTVKRAKMARYLIENRQYDLVFVAFTEVDRMQHYTLNRKDWKDYVMPLYKHISDFIEWTMEHARKEKEDATIMLVSDHGAQPIRHKFMINAWLVKNGYTVLKPGYARAFESKKASGESKPGIKYTIREQIIKSKAKKLVYDRMPASLRRGVAKAMGGVLAAGSGEDYTRIHDFDIDMGKTRAFTSVSNNPVGLIWINDARFADPQVNGNEKEQLKKEISEELRKVKTLEGKSLVANIYDGAEYYKNTKEFIPPDLMVEVEKGYIVDIKDYSPTRIYIDPDIARSGDHIREGIFGAIAPNGKRIKVQKDRINIYNFRQTVLSYFGLKEGRKGRAPMF
ncbi:MAG: alkaline phosphatase family protein [Candidatus Micrarchaeota archaeon]|nr:alkaline phosphatase family protein [Candidatus Micrarchaeota archaeon]MDE1824318.1 alkaline phosphatase family protein [Candidatus Micrarchaeota archaeon]